MYTKKATISTKLSASHLCHNLSTWKVETSLDHREGTCSLAYAHQDKIKFITLESPDSINVTKSSETSLSNPNSTVFQAKVIQVFGGMMVLVIITESNIQFFDTKASTVLFMYIPDLLIIDDGHHFPLAPLASGISSIGDTA